MVGDLSGFVAFLGEMEQGAHGRAVFWGCVSGGWRWAFYMILAEVRHPV